MTAVPTSKPKTVEDLIALESETDERYEIIDGELVETSVSFESSRTNAQFAICLGNFLAANPIGVVCDAELSFELPRSTRKADVSVILNARVPEDDVSYFVGAPDIVVEVISPSDRTKAVSRKVQEWLDSGAQIVWLVSPFERHVMVYRRGVPPRLILERDFLDGEDILPGFSVEVSRLFGSQPKNQL